MRTHHGRHKPPKDKTIAISKLYASIMPESTMMLGAFLLAEPAKQEQIARFELKPTLKPTLNEKYPPGTMLS